MTQTSAPTATPSSPLCEAVRGINEISTLPQIALRVMQVANDPNSGAGDLKGVMESDAALSARILRCVNSSAYAVRHEITNLQQAIAYLGLKQIRNLAITASVGEMFKKEENIGCYSRSGLWEHLVSVGICARLIAMRRKSRNFEDMFLAGLLHDVGIILEDEHVHEGFCQVLASVAEGTPLVETERARLGFDHTALGQQVASNWGFPDAVKDTIRWHHASSAYKGKEAECVQCVEVANLICSIKGITSIGVALVKFDPRPIAELGLSKDDVLILAEDLDDELARAQSLFHI
jgi:putative nucleotidyltransferase with HDIG domain